MLVGLHVLTNFQIYRQTLTLSKCMCMRASGASELRKFWHFYILKLLFLSIFCRYSRYFVGTNDMLVGLHVPTNFLIYRQTLTLSKCMCMRASGASELRKFWHFYILNLLFLSIFCRYIRYFVGTNDMLVGSHVPTNFQMYRQKSERALLGGGGGAAAPPAPPPPSGYANDASPKPEFFLFSLFIFAFISQLIWVRLGWNFHRWFSTQKQVNWYTIDPVSL